MFTSTLERAQMTGVSGNEETVNHEDMKEQRVIILHVYVNFIGGFSAAFQRLRSCNSSD